jgi:hypothetical protein
MLDLDCTANKLNKLKKRIRKKIKNIEIVLYVKRTRIVLTNPYN